MDSLAAPTTQHAPARLAELDGIRGWASLAVLLFHALPEINRNVLPELSADPVSMLLDGTLAVYVFFILSGEALSVGYLRTGDPGILRTLAGRRYFRLTVPILMACSLVWLAMLTGLDAHHEAAERLRSGWLDQFLAFAPSLSWLLRYSFYGVYFEIHLQSHYIPLLWTMRIELLGSCVVLGALPLLHAVRRRPRQLFAWYVVLIVALAVFDRTLVGFPIGMLLAEARQRGWWDRLRATPWRWLVVAAGLALLPGLSWVRAVAHHDAAMRYLLRAYAGHSPDDVPAPVINPLLMYANAFGLFLLVPMLPPLGRFLSGGLSRFLGRISFPLYLVQFPVLITLTSWLAVWLLDPDDVDPVVLYGIAAATIVASLLLAVGFGWAERHVLRVVNRGVGWLLG